MYYTVRMICELVVTIQFKIIKVLGMLSCQLWRCDGIEKLDADNSHADKHGYNYMKTALTVPFSRSRNAAVYVTPDFRPNCAMVHIDLVREGEGRFDFGS